MVKYFLYSTLFLILFLTSCKKPFERACFKSVGSDDYREIQLNVDNDSLYLADDIEYTIIPSSKNKIGIYGGENIITFIDVQEHNKALTIEDNNKCKFLRSYKEKIKVDLYIDSLKFIFYTGSTSLKTRDTLRSNSLVVVQKDGAGEMDLIVQNGYTSVTITNGFGNFKLRGRTLIGHVGCSANSYCDALDFKASQKLIVKSRTVSYMKVNAKTQFFDGLIEDSGDVYYKGKPEDKSLEKKGKGNFIPL